MPSRSSTASSSQDASAASGAKRWNKGSIWAFVISLIGIPLFGIVTGLVAILVACIALVGHRHNQRGLALGVLAIVIGMADVVGWAVGMSYYVGSSQTMVSLQDMAIDLESLDDLPDHLARAMRANVVVHSAVSLGRESMGSGVVLSIHDKLAYIVTNRHVVDPEYTGENSPPPDDLSTFDRIFISTLEHATLPAKVEWIAPGGVDLAILSTSVHGDGVRAARWSLDTTPHIGDKVFAIGNPHGLGWTHSSGDISQIRARSQGGYRVRILQTTAAINPGNSGGGLYDEKGQLIGVNTLTGDKRVAEGLGFSIALPTLLDLAPKRLATLTKDTEASSE
ncbi:S1C family serine protease [Aeoliella sp. ICT_H6.2]|uniref:S1C family serine protease n=1 Tax=Aeoliella straminimaris TaxID=2954799 RepID=A0A9X2FD66_9BACT|nr:S1C family serine protease [Aeoliella straminimaris]MCO6044119.1 S1C family serine protease [Aeoliella straminimaris]